MWNFMLSAISVQNKKLYNHIYKKVFIHFPHRLPYKKRKKILKYKLL